MNEKAKLVLIPSALGEDGLGAIPPVVLPACLELRFFIVEEIRTARRFLRSIGYNIDFELVTFFHLDKNLDTLPYRRFLQPALEGHSIGLLSEAGLPAVADPGAEVVRHAHALGIAVRPLPGPSSLLLALMVSGMNGQHFAFRGYLPVKGPDRKKRIRELEEISSREQQTQLFIETPYRNQALLADLLESCKEDTLLCVAMALTTSGEWIRSCSIREWKQQPVGLPKKPAVFVLLRPR